MKTNNYELSLLYMLYWSVQIPTSLQLDIILQKQFQVNLYYNECKNTK